MKFRLFILTSCFCHQIIHGQIQFAQVSVAGKMKDSFSFAGEWDYDWDIFKESNGKFSAADGRKIKAKDTAHLYFTAKCLTNVQGGYTIRYCYADQVGDTLRLVFSDGLPAYASNFYVYIINDSFYFQPETIYPAYVSGQKFTYEVTKQKMTVNKSSYKPGEIIMGEVDVEFKETFTAPGFDPRIRQYYLKGLVRTPLKRTQDRR